MIVGLKIWELHMSGCRSLKEKRRILKSLKDRLHNQFNVSVAETNHHDSWQRSELACCVVAIDRRHSESVLSSADRLIESDGFARVVDSSTSFL